MRTVSDLERSFGNQKKAFVPDKGFFSRPMQADEAEAEMKQKQPFTAGTAYAMRLARVESYLNDSLTLRQLFQQLSRRHRLLRNPGRRSKACPSRPERRRPLFEGGLSSEI
ncbi:hypothetical protein ACLBWT_01040 [Paenibacillus sp. D51F]